VRVKASDILENPILYSGFQRLVKTQRYNQNLDHLIGSFSVSKVLDFGCGPGDLYEKIDCQYYFGIDPSKECIDMAKKRFPNYRLKGEFCIGNQEQLKCLTTQDFDLIIAIGVFHHMSDPFILDFLKQAHRILKTGGRIVTLDPVRHENESLLSGFLVQQDRGRNVRTPDGYISLVKNYPFSVESQIHVGLLRIPYDQFSMTCVKLD
jgi:ubiquinone/menaquinone biosynthesis C-methylase UbiE